MKTIIAVGDGMADNPVASLDDQTPLEAACHPTLDLLAQQGELGTVRTIPHGIDPGSDTAFLSILGYDPRSHFSGRAPLEAAGCGVSLQKGELAYRCNIIAVEDIAQPFEEKRILSHNGGHVEGEEALALMHFLLEDTEFSALLQQNSLQLHVMPAFRQIAVQTKASNVGLHTTPPHDHLGEALGPLLPKGNDIAQGLCDLIQVAHRLLNHHPINEKRRKENRLPANCIWFWAEGMVPSLESFEKLHHKHGFVVSAVPLVHGIAALTGLKQVPVEGATGDLDTNFEGKATAILQGLQSGYDFALLHVEAPDECTHNGDIKGKVRAIEAFDTRCLHPLLQGLHKNKEDFRLLILSDHKTLSSTRGHDAGPVPYILYDSQKCNEPLQNERYTEACAKGGPFIQSGPELLLRLFKG